MIQPIAGTTGQRFTLSESTGTWQQGLNACRGVQGTLANVNNPQYQNLFSTQVTTAQLGEKIWVGSFEAYTRMVWVQGKMNRYFSLNDVFDIKKYNSNCASVSNRKKENIFIRVLFYPLTRS